MKKKFTFLMALFALMLITLPGMVMGQTKDNATLKYSGSTTTNMTGNNDAATLGLNANDWSVVGAKGSQNNYPGLNKDGTIRLYAGSNSDGNGAYITVTNLDGNTISSITPDVKSGTLTVYVGSSTVTANQQGVYTINSTAFSVKNCQTTGQVQINSITIAYSSGFSVTYNKNGEDVTGNVPTDNTTYSNNGTVTVLGNVGSPALAKTGHTFEGWCLNAQGTGTVYGPGDGQTHTYTITANTTFYAKWIPETYTITYKAGFGDQPDIEETKTYGVDYTIADNAFDAPSSSHTFIGWKDGNNNDWTVGATYTTNAPLTLTAQWTDATIYDVLYECNGGTDNCPSDASYEENTVIQLPAAPTYTDHTFNGWLDDASTPVNHAAGSDYTVTGDVMFTAQWLENLTTPTFTVTGVSNGTANTYYVTANIAIDQEEGANVYYTTDGSNPVSSATKIEYEDSFDVTESCTIKAVAIFDGFGNSSIAEQAITIVQPNNATFTDGVYASLNTEANYNTWYKYNVSGDQVWSWASYNQTYYAKMSGYASSTNNANEDWLISPKMTVTNGKLAVSFDCAAKFGTNKLCTAQYSTDYPGYGDPSDYTWTKLIDLPTANNYTFEEQNMTITGVTSDVYVAIKYVSNTDEASTIEINNFTAKQCYPITYYANYENPTGATTDPDSPYAVGTEVTILENTFTPPTGKEFTSWNTQSDGLGTTKNPGNKITMTTAGYELYAIWGDACVDEAVMNATTGAAAYNYNGGNKRFDINLSSSVKTLGGCDIYDYGFVYSTTVTTPTVDGLNCTKVQVGDSQATVDDPFVTTIEGATLCETYYVCSYATNNAGTAYSDVLEVEVPANFDNYKYEISYTTNGTAEASTYVYQGAPISGLATPTADNIPAGYTFMGWYGDDYALNNTAPAFVKNGDAINSDLALKAVFAIQTGVGSADTYTLVDDDEDLNDGDIVVLYSTGTYKTSGITYTFSKANGAINGGLFSDEDVEVNNYQFTSTDVVPMTLVKTNSKWKLQIGNQFVAAANKGVSLNNTGSENSISITDGVATITASISSTDYDLQYNPNSGNGRFAYYSSTQKAISLYKQNSPTYSCYCTSVSTQAAISGTITEGHLTTNGTIAPGTAVYLTAPLTINSGCTLTVNGAIGNDDPANLIIEDGGQLVTTNSVKATLKKSTVASTATKATNKWYLISSPVSDIEISSFVPAEQTDDKKWDVYRYDEPTRYWNEYRSTDPAYPSFSTLTSGVGYLYRSTVAGIEFKGDVNVGDATYKLKYTDEGDNMNGFNLIGNPFSYNIYKGVEIPNTDLEPNFYVLEANGGWTLSYDHGTSDPAGPTAITPNTAILVQAISTANDKNLTISKSSKGGDYKYGNDQISFRVENSEYSDIACVLFREGHGLNKISHRNAEIPMLYVTKEGENFASANMPDNTSVINLGFEAKTIGQYTFSLKAEGQYSYMHLYDKLTGNDVDMLLEDSYTFIGAPSDRKDRFVLNLNYSAGSSTGSETFAYQSGNDIMVSGEGELQVFDVMGRMVMSRRINGVETVNGLNNGVYIFRMEGKTQKIVVR